jgi:glycosyltransferase involved in cell wall biosynthesis
MARAAERPKVVVIGPVLPFRGGIAQHTTMLARALAERAEVRVLSFSRQYPGWLFPGASDRDPGFLGHVEPGTEYVIDSLDPRTWRRAARLALEAGPSLVVMPWWTAFWAPCFASIARRVRAAGVPVVFLCHNVIEHDASPLSVRLTRRVLRHGSSFVAHTTEDEANLLRLVPEARVKVRPHPVYEQFPEPEDKLPRRAALELLFFGFVRPYKGLDILLDAMELLRDEEVHLTVAGEFWKGLDETRHRLRASGMESRVELVPRYLTESETAEYFARADVVVLPYRGATGSGVVAIAYHYGKPVIVTSVGGLPDVVRQGETGVVVPPSSPGALAEAIRGFTAERAAGMRDAIAELRGTMTWEALADAVLSSVTTAE